MNFKHYYTDIWDITKKTYAAWNKADPFRQSATIAYYAIFSIPALLVIIISSAGLAFGEDAVRGHISGQISSALGNPEAGLQIEEMIAKASSPKKSIIATVISVITLILGSTGVFGQLQIALNEIWEVKVSSKKKWIYTLKSRLFSFGLVLSIAFLLLVSLMLTAGLSVFSDWLRNHFPDFIVTLFQLVNFLVSFGVVTVLFALMFKILPDANIRWKDVWIGSIATALLFTIGKTLLGFYFGKANPGSTYGAAGSVILMMLWVSYSCMILFFGAEFTKQFAVHSGRDIIPKRDAVKIELPKEEQLIGEKQMAVDKVDEKKS